MMYPFSMYDICMLGLANSGIDLSDWYFYVDFNQTAGPTRLVDEAPEITINGTTEEPIILLLGQDATTSSWPNRGSLGGSLEAVNIRPEDLGWNTPYTDGTKSVRFQSTAGGTRRYYRFNDTSIGDIDTEDLIIEYIMEPTSASPSAFDSIVCVKRNWTLPAHDGFGVYSVSSTTQSFALGTQPSANIRAASFTRTARAWLHGIAYLDNSLGGAHNLGSQSSVVVGSLALGSLTNTMPFTVGDSTVPGFYTNASAVDFRLAYLAVWKRANWFAGPTIADNTAALQAEVRKRQQYLGGFVPTKGTTSPSTITITSRYTDTYNESTGKFEAHFAGSGCMTPYIAKIADTGEYVNALRPETGFTGTAAAETFATFTPQNCSIATNTTLAIPQSNPVGFTSTGVGLTGNIGTGLRSLQLITTVASTTRRNIYQLWVAPGTANFFHIGALDTVGGSNRRAWVNLTTGEITYDSASNLYCDARPYINGWWHIVFLFNNGSSSSDITADIGFSDSASTTDCTCDGTSITGYLFGWNNTSSVNTAYPNTPLPYSPTNSAVGNGPIIIYPGVNVTSYPLSLWFEIFTPNSTEAFNTAAYPLQLSTDSNNAIYAVSTVTANVTNIGFAGITNGTIVWDIGGIQTGDNSTTTGKRTRFTGVVAASTNDVYYLNNSGSTIGTDTINTPITLPATNLRIGNSAGGTVAGRGTYISRVGIANIAKTTSSGPAGSGVIE